MKNLVDPKVETLCRDLSALKEHIRTKLAGHRPKTYRFSSKKSIPAGVLFPLFFKEGQAHLLFTKRTDHLEHHKGQIAFPGGKRDKTDANMLETTLRETREEVGITENDIEILGQADRFQTNTYFLITPYVGVFPYPYPYTVSPGEIERLIEVPLLHLLRDDVFETKPFEKNGIIWQVHYYYFGDDTIWGVTGFLLSRFLSLVFDLERPLHLPQVRNASTLSR